MLGACSNYRGVGSVSRWHLPSRMERLKEGHERSCFRRAQIFSIGRHIASALDHLPDELVLSKVHSNTVQSRSALASIVIE